MKDEKKSLDDLAIKTTLFIRGFKEERGVRELSFPYTLTVMESSHKVGGYFSELYLSEDFFKKNRIKPTNDNLVGKELKLSLTPRPLSNAAMETARHNDFLITRAEPDEYIWWQYEFKDKRIVGNVPHRMGENAYFILLKHASISAIQGELKLRVPQNVYDFLKEHYLDPPPLMHAKFKLVG